MKHDDFSGGLRINTVNIHDFISAREQFAKCLCIELSDNKTPDNLADQLLRFIKPCLQGQTPIKFKYTMNGSTAIIPLSSDWQVQPTNDLLYHLEGIEGCERATLEY